MEHPHLRNASAHKQFSPANHMPANVRAWLFLTSQAKPLITKEEQMSYGLAQGLQKNKGLLVKEAPKFNMGF